MKKPYVICHILSALDGKIVGDFMSTSANIKASEQYAKVRETFSAQAWLYGTTTTKEFTNFKNPVLDGLSDDVPSGDFVAQNGWDLYYISVDTLGEIGWDSGVYKREGRKDSHIIEIITEKTPKKYRAYLRKLGVSYIIAGTDSLDCKLAIKKLNELFNIDKILICGGGTVNWSFLSQGAVDELSLILSPTADGETNTPTVFERMSQNDNSSPVTFKLKSVSKLENDTVHLTYLAENRKD